jgi:hypothetical protein
VSASASRDSIFFSAECLRQDSDALLNVLRDISLFPELNDWELEVRSRCVLAFSHAALLVVVVSPRFLLNVTDHASVSLL